MPHTHTRTQYHYILSWKHASIYINLGTCGMDKSAECTGQGGEIGSWKCSHMDWLVCCLSPRFALDLMGLTNRGRLYLHLYSNLRGEAPLAYRAHLKHNPNQSSRTPIRTPEVQLKNSRTQTRTPELSLYFGILQLDGERNISMKAVKYKTNNQTNLNLWETIAETYCNSPFPYRFHL